MNIGNSFVCAVILVLVGYSDLVSTQNVKEVGGLNCTVINETSYVYTGWPGVIACHDYTSFVYSVYDEYTEYIGDIRTQCLVTDASNGKILLNVTELYGDLPSYTLTPDFSGNQSRVYIIDIVTPDYNECRSFRLTFNVTDSPYSTCDDAVRRMKHNSVPRFAGQSYTGLCNSPADALPQIRLDRQNHNFTVQWFYNCSTLPNDTSVRPARSSSVFDQINIPSVTYSHPGIYTCAVTYKGMTQYVVHHDVCVRGKRATDVPSIKCRTSSVTVTELGGNVTLECNGTFGAGTISSLSRASWFKVDSKFECFLFNNGIYNAQNGSRHFCSRALRGLDATTCYREPVSEAILVQGNYLLLKLHLINVNVNDLGTYTLIVRNPTGLNSTENVTIILDTSSQEFQTQALGIGLGVGIALFLLLILLLLLVFRFYVAVYWKIFFGGYVLDDKQFGAFLSYHFSKEIDVFAQQQARDTCAAARDELEKLGFSTYDEHKDGNDGFRAANAINVMKKCHRVVIILSNEYVRDNWSVFQLQQGFKTMIEDGSKMVFVLVPGMKEYINQQAATDDTYRMIQRAIKINYAITWPCKTCCGDRFKLEMRQAMPKIRKGDSRVGNGSHPNGVDRVLSNTTAFTDIGMGSEPSNV